MVDEVERLLSVIRDSLHCKDDDHLLLFKKDCADLARRISLLSNFLEEIRGNHCSSSSSWRHDLLQTVNAALQLLTVARSFSSSDSSSDSAEKKIGFQFQCVTWQLEKVLRAIPLEKFEISDEVQEQVALVRSQLRRTITRYGSMESRMITFALAQPIDKEERGNTPAKSSSTDNENGTVSHKTTTEESAVKIPEDLLCPISLEIMRDPVIVSTGQTYERSCIQRWIDSGNATCPKTGQKLEHRTLTPNYVLRSFISHWCLANNVKQPTWVNWKSSDRSFGEMEAIQGVVCKLSSRSLDERLAAVAEIRSLSKRSTDNRILIAEAGAIPMLVDLLKNDDVSIQENAVTAILNLSIWENNKGLIMLAGAVPCVVNVLRFGSVEARGNAAATLFSLSIVDENKVIIGASGAIPALVDLLENGSARGKKDAATALYNLCIYHGNKGRAVKGGIVRALVKMMREGAMADEALTIMSVLASNQEAKVAIVRASAIPALIDELRAAPARNKENAAAILVALCKRDVENLRTVSRLGAAIPLAEIARSGTERAKRKAVSLLDNLRTSRKDSTGNE